jgi:chromosome segregation ATPase
LPIVDERTELISYSVQADNITPDTLLMYVGQKAISDDGRKQMQGIIDQKGRIAGTDISLAQAHSEMEEASRAQDRLRQNIQTLNYVNGQHDQVQEWAKQLAEEEVHITALRDQISALDKKKAALEAELGDMIGKLEF